MLVINGDGQNEPIYYFIVTDETLNTFDPVFDCISSLIDLNIVQSFITYKHMAERKIKMKN